jgi:hypothetical protein
MIDKDSMIRKGTADEPEYVIQHLPRTVEDQMAVIDWIVDSERNADYSQGLSDGYSQGFARAKAAEPEITKAAYHSGFIQGQNVAYAETLNKMSEVEPARPIVKVVRQEQPTELVEAVEALNKTVRALNKNTMAKAEDLEITRDENGFITGFAPKGTSKPKTPKKSYDEESLPGGGTLFQKK